MPTIFTRIITGEIPSHKVYEDEFCYAFLDINPVTKGHTLIVPKQEYQRMQECPDNILAHMFLVAKELMKKMIDTFDAEYVQVMVEGLEVPHFHIHLIPNMKSNKILELTRVSYDAGEAEKIASQLQ